MGGDDVPTRQTILAFVAPASGVRLSRPKKQLCAFVKTPELRVLESCQIELQIEAYDLGVFDALVKRWVIDAGTTLNILIGTNASDATVIGNVEVPKEIAWVHTYGDI
jgi:beta-glucosidase